MPGLYKSFRFYGNFELYDVKKKDAFGTMLDTFTLYHAQPDWADELKTFVRFCAFDDRNDQADLPEKSANIFNADAKSGLLAQLAASESVSFWVCESDGTTTGKTLAVRKAICMDQFTAPDFDKPTERYPLCAKFNHNGTVYATSVTFGQGSESNSMRLALGFPALWCRGEPELATAIGGVYPTTSNIDASEKFTIPSTILFGPEGATEEAKNPDPRRIDQYLLTEPRLDAKVPSLSFGHGKPGDHKNTPVLAPLVSFMGINAEIDRGKTWLQMVSAEGDAGFEYVCAVSQRFIPTPKYHKPKYLDLAEQLGAKLPFGNFIAEFYWKIILDDAGIKSALAGNNPDLGLESVSQIRWTDKIGSANKPFPANDVLRGAGLTAVARIANTARKGLIATDRQPQSVLPAFSNISGLSNTAVPLVAYARGIPLDFILGEAPRMAAGAEDSDTVQFGITLDTAANSKTGEPAVRHPIKAPEGTAWKYAAKLESPVSLNLRLPAFNDHQQEKEHSNKPDHHHVRLGFDPTCLDGDKGSTYISIRIENHPTEPLRKFEGRLGSLAFRGAKQSLLADENESKLIIRRGDRRKPDPRTPTAPALDVTWKLDLAIETARPVAIDIPHGQRGDHENDMLIHEKEVELDPDPVTEGAGTPTAPFSLQITERLRDDQDRHLTAYLKDTSAATAATQVYTVIGKKPFFAYRFMRKSLSGTGSDDNNLVATYDSDDREWRLKKSSDTYAMIRPAGATGESADKPGRLEIHDAGKRDNEEGIIRPALEDKKGPEEDERGVKRRHVVDMRLSPPSMLWVEPSDLVRNYYLPEYAGRELFRQQGDFGLGMALAGLRTELVYGLSTGVAVPPPTANTPAPRVAEVGALSGKPLGKVPDPNTTDEKSARRWQSLRAGFAHRPERLEIWNLDPSKQNPFVPASFKDGLTHALRHTATMAPPIDSELATPGTATQNDVKSVRFDKKGLYGGALWPVESANVARILAENPVGSGGTLDRIALSPLGDSGDQTVRFLGNFAAVITETREGRLQKHRVEIMGRISALWHRAKHVVVYERTTAPSAQFTPKNQPSRSRRPILRKVEEFIEILEPSRQYPDTPGASQRGRGFLEEVRFNSRIIHVNSAWGGDVGRNGWEVPLWNRHEAAIRPQVYPYPDVAFITAGEGEAENPQAIHDCLDVANLYFYTDPVAAQDLGESDNWPARQGVDFSVLGHQDILDSIIEKPDEKKPARRPAAPRIMPGLGRFSWRLAPSAVRTRLNQGRGRKPIFAGVESVSMMRGPMVKNDEALSNFGALLVQQAAVAKQQAKSAEYSVPIDEIALKIKVIANKDPATLKKKDTAALKASLEKFPHTDVQATVQGFITNFKNNTKFKSGPLKKILNLDKAACGKIASDAAATVRNRKTLIMQMVRQAESSVLARMRKAKGLRKGDAIKWLNEELDDATRDIFAQVSTGFGEVLGGVANAKSITGDWRADAVAAQNRAQARIFTLKQSYDQNKPWSRNRLNYAMAALQAEIDAARAEAIAALDETRLRLAHELDGATQDLGARISAAIALSQKSNAKVQDQVSTFNERLAKGADSLNKVIAKLPTNQKISDIKTKLAKKDKEKFAEVIEALDGLDIDGTKQSAVAKVDGVTAKLQSNAKSLGTFSAGTNGEITDGLKDFNKATKQLESAFDVLSDETDKDLKQAIGAAHDAMSTIPKKLVEMLEKRLKPFGLLDQAYTDAIEWSNGQITELGEIAADVLDKADAWLDDFSSKLTVLQSKLPGEIKAAFTASVIEPAITATLEGVNWDAIQKDIKALETVILQLSDNVETKLDALENFSGKAIDLAKTLCTELAAKKAKLIEDAQNYAVEIVEPIQTKINALVAKIKNDLPVDPEELKTYIEDLVGATNKVLRAADEIELQVQQAGEHARAYLNRGAAIIDKMHDAKATELPGLALQLMSAATQSPEIAAFKTNADRIRLVFNETKDAIKTLPLEGLLDQMGDALKALGLNFDFSQFSDTFKIDLPDGDKFLRNLVPSFGGIDISNLLPTASLPANLKDVVRVTHDLDVKAGRAWVRADVNVPLPKREPMFSIGPFTLFLTRSRLEAFMRAEASKDRKETAVTDRAMLSTTLEAVVGGQVMVTLEDVKITYSSAENLDFDINPSKIKIHKNMQFIQDYLGALFGDSLGGLKFIKESGIPVGVEHQFALPNISIMSGTSGIQFLKISNRFSLRAYPDFVIANRFNLSRREVPFLFSVFIIGGTGYMQVDTEYRPFDKALIVVVEAGVGGSAAFGFAFGPVSGGVYITLSVVLRYQKRIGNGDSSEDGLSVSLVLVIGGMVSLWGIVTVQLSLSLAISYHESGQMDGLGQLSVTVRVSKWFKLKYATQVKYTLRNGQSTTQVSSQTDVSGEALDKLEKLDKVRKSL